jgi:nucleoid DNA-binding protein
MTTHRPPGSKILHKQAIVRQLGQRTRLSNQVVAQVIDCLVDILSEHIAAGGRTEIANFLVLETQMRTRLVSRSDTGDNGLSDEPISETFPVLKCRPGKRLRQMMKRSMGCRSRP